MDEVLDDIATGLTEVKEEYAPESIAGYHCTRPRQSTPSSRLITHARNNPNVINTDLHISFGPSVGGGTYPVGHSIIAVFKSTVDGIL